MYFKMKNTANQGLLFRQIKKLSKIKSLLSQIHRNRSRPSFNREKKLPSEIFKFKVSVKRGKKSFL